MRYEGNASTITNVELGEPGASVASPITGTVIRWRMAGNFLGGPFELRVLKPTFGGQYTYGAISEAASPTGIPQTIGSDLPIEAGDVIALEVPNDSSVGFIELPGSEADRAVAHPPVAEGQAWEPTSQRAGWEFAFNADVLAPPSVTAISPATGTTSGASSVSISGSNFSEVRKVDFGGTATTSYTVNSESSITAMSPPTSAPGPVDVTVTTAAGTSPSGSADSFTYTTPPAPPAPPAISPPPAPLCRVPDLGGKSLRVAMREIHAADCKVGRVTRGHGTRAKVVGQKPKAGTVSAADTVVVVTLGKGAVSASGRPNRSCPPQKSRTLAADRLAIAFTAPATGGEMLGRVEVCAPPSGRPFSLARGNGRISQRVALDGAWVAGTAAGAEPQDYFFADAVALNAQTHRRNRCRIGAANQPGRLPTFIHFYVSQQSGSVAWSATLHSERPTPVIGICMEGQTRILDEGPGINLRSLSATRSRLHWITAGGQERSFSFR